MINYQAKYCLLVQHIDIDISSDKLAIFSLNLQQNIKYFKINIYFEKANSFWKVFTFEVVTKVTVISSTWFEIYGWNPSTASNYSKSYLRLDEWCGWSFCLSIRKQTIHSSMFATFEYAGPNNFTFIRICCKLSEKILASNGAYARRTRIIEL